ncbi:hypothetical protein EG327_004751 [Venturia inaequalis]|uniref:Bul1 N-terminal domain-containing protein n=1 Tax=Venturia inaequalis TaxID=5025 RepID=A0A8H3VNC9_VENIN|nr:hypothetical protein EG327_004751 [Venturia inaequalis]
MDFFAKPDIEISLARSSDAPDSYVTSFSTLDKIQGFATIVAKKDTKFDDLHISFVGVTNTYVDKMSSSTTMSGRTKAVHRFLKLEQPIREADLPHPRILEAGKEYKFAFTFVVPQQLLPLACVHKTTHQTIRDTHLQLPPSFGDPVLSGYGPKLLDDMAPDMTKITYGIKVKLLKDEGEETNTIVEATKRLRIKPAFEEHPPIDIDGTHEDYCHRQEKTIRKGIWKGKLGRLVIEASQPKSFHLPAVPPGEAIPAVSTMAKVVLRFDPASESCPPPRLGSLSSKLKVCTYFATTPRQALPTRTQMNYDMTQGYISDMIQLSSMCVASVYWQKHEAWESPESRRASTLSTMSTTMKIGSNTLSPGLIPDASSSYKGNSFYTASILVPMSLPASKHLVPTFHTCLVSRQYALHLNLSTHGQPLGPSVNLKLPIQISSEGSVGVVQRRRMSEEAVQAAMDAEATFMPRVIAPPSDEYLGNSAVGGPLEPPGYNSFQGFRPSRASVQRAVVPAH